MDQTVTNKPEWSGKSKGGALGYRFFIVLIKHTSIKVTYFFIRIVALYYLIFTAKSASRFFFSTILGYSRCRTVSAIYRNYCLLGEVLVDKVAMFSGSKTGFTFDFDGEEHLRAMSSEGMGGILIGAHMGNWEIAG